MIIEGRGPAPSRAKPWIRSALAGLLALACDGGAPPAERVHGPPEGGLVFVRLSGERTDLWRARLADGALRPLTATPGRRELWPLWSDAAGLLVFEARPEGQRGRRSLRLWRARDGAELPLPVEPSGIQAWADWAPARAWLAYAFAPGGTRKTPGGVARLDLVTGELAPLAANREALRFIRPAFAPGGEPLVAQGVAGAASQVFLLAEGSPPRPLTGPDEFAAKPRFTRDGRRIVFTRADAAEEPGRIEWMLPDGTRRGRLTGAASGGEDGARPSPTRDEVVFVAERGDATDLWLVDLPGGEPRNLTAALGIDAGPGRWSPDGERFAFVAEPRAGAGGAADAAGGPLVVVIDRSGRELLRTPGFSPAWMPAWR